MEQQEDVGDQRAIDGEVVLPEIGLSVEAGAVLALVFFDHGRGPRHGDRSGGFGGRSGLRRRGRGGLGGRGGCPCGRWRRGRFRGRRGIGRGGRGYGHCGLDGCCRSWRGGFFRRRLVLTFGRRWWGGRFDFLGHAWVYRTKPLSFRKPSLLTSGRVTVNDGHHKAIMSLAVMLSSPVDMRFAASGRRGKPRLYGRTSACTSVAQPESSPPDRVCARRQPCDVRDWRPGPCLRVDSIRISDHTTPVEIFTEATCEIEMLSSVLPNKRRFTRLTRSGPTTIRVGNQSSLRPTACGKSFLSRASAWTRGTRTEEATPIRARPSSKSRCSRRSGSRGISAFQPARRHRAP